MNTSRKFQLLNALADKTSNATLRVNLMMFVDFVAQVLNGGHEQWLENCDDDVDQIEGAVEYLFGPACVGDDLEQSVANEVRVAGYGVKAAVRLAIASRMNEAMRDDLDSAFYFAGVHDTIVEAVYNAVSVVGERS